MATQEDTTSSTDETSGQEQQQDQQQQTTSETEGNGQQQQESTSEPARLPDDHPLVKTLAANKTKIAEQSTALREANARAAKVTQLEEELGKRPTTEAVEALQNRYDRLEEFLQSAGGPLGRALDSRSFTRDLFESDKDIATIVKDWNKANPTATREALQAGGNGDSKVDNKDANALIRAAWNGGQKN